MKLIVNGQSKEFDDDPLWVVDLLERLSLEGRPVLVEHNGKALHPRDFGETKLGEGDRLEIIQIVAGG